MKKEVFVIVGVIASYGFIGSVNGDGAEEVIDEHHLGKNGCNNIEQGGAGDGVFILVDYSDGRRYNILKYDQVIEHKVSDRVVSHPKLQGCHYVKRVNNEKSLVYDPVTKIVIVVSNVNLNL